jgi:hypothetical protein
METCKVGDVDFLVFISKQREKQLLNDPNPDDLPLNVSISPKSDSCMVQDERPLENWLKDTNEVAILLAKIVDPVTLFWIISDYFFRGESSVDSLVHGPTLKTTWLAHPILSAAIFLACIDKKKGTLKNNVVCPITATVVRVEPAHAQQLADLIFKAGSDLTAFVAADKPSMNPTIPLASLITALLAVRIIQLQYSRTKMSAYSIHHFFSIHLIASWELHRIDQFCSSSVYPNAYLQNLWKSVEFGKIFRPGD